MNKKEQVIDYLNGYKRSFNRWKFYAEQIRLLREKQMTAGSPNLSGLPKGNASVDMSDYIVRLEIQIERCMKQQEKAHREMKKVKDVIVEVYDETDRMILNYRYLDLMTFVEIGETMGLGKSTVSRRHDEACERLWHKLFN